MKGLTKIIFTVIACIIISIVILYIVVIGKTSYFEKSLELLRRFKTYKPYMFDVNDLLVDPNDPTAFDATSHTKYYEDSNDPTFCKDLRSCIETNIKGNVQCVITYKVKPGVTFSPDNITDSILNHCPAITDIKEELYGGTGRKVCKFKSNSINSNINKFREDNVTLINYEPFIHNCYIPDNLGSYNVLDDVDSINYLYSGRGTENGYDFKNGGTVRIIVTNVSIKNDFDATCSYSLYVCGQNAIAAKENETPIYVFRDIQNLNEKELYYNETIVWAGTPKEERVDITWWVVCKSILTPLSLDFLCGAPPQLPIGYNLYGYNPRTYEFNFNGIYKNKEVLIDAVDAGMWEWSKSHYSDEESTKYFRDAYYPDITDSYFSYSPIDTANISEDNSINFDSGCWNVGYENSNVRGRTQLWDDTYNLPEGSFANSNIFRHIFNFSSFTIGDRIRMVLGIKKIFITEKPFAFNFALWSGEKYILDDINNKYKINIDPRVILVMDPVTFCSE